MTMSHRPTSLVSLFLAVIVGLSGCASSAAEGGGDSDAQGSETSTVSQDVEPETIVDEPGDQEPPSGRWVLESGSINSAPVLSVPQEKMTLRFRDDGSITGWNGCHDLLGSVTFMEPGQVRLEAGLADVPCDTDEPYVDFQAAETYVLGLVRYVHAWRMDGDRLVLSGPSTKLVFTR